jgi:septation ring formation regulator EzrA
MDEKLTEIADSLKSIEKRLESLEHHLKIVNKDCSKMNEHIQFVEKTYNAARTPLNFLKNKIELIMGTSSTNELPKLEYKETGESSSPK